MYLRVVANSLIFSLAFFLPTLRSVRALGDWSDSSSKWKEHPEAAKQLNWSPDENDGSFHITVEDLIKHFVAVNTWYATLRPPSLSHLCLCHRL